MTHYVGPHRVTKTTDEIITNKRGRKNKYKPVLFTISVPCSKNKCKLCYNKNCTHGCHHPDIQLLK